MCLPEWVRGLLDEGRVAHLGLRAGAGAPRVLPVTYARWGGALWSAVDYKPKRRRGEDLARVRWLRADPRAALTVDRYAEDWSRLAWVQVLGVVTILGVAGHEDALAALAARYRAYRERPPGAAPGAAARCG